VNNFKKFRQIITLFLSVSQPFKQKEGEANGD